MSGLWFLREDQFGVAQGARRENVLRGDPHVVADAHAAHGMRAHDAQPHLPELGAAGAAVGREHAFARGERSELREVDARTYRNDDEHGDRDEPPAPGGERGDYEHDRHRNEAATRDADENAERAHRDRREPEHAKPRATAAAEHESRGEGETREQIGGEFVRIADRSRRTRAF